MRQRIARIKLHERVKETAEKYKIQAHCISDQILLYLRYMQDNFKVEDDFIDKLNELYKQYRIVNATSPEKFMGWLGEPPIAAANIFYLAVGLYKEEYSTLEFITKKEIADCLGVSEHSIRIKKADRLYQIIK